MDNQIHKIKLKNNLKLILVPNLKTNIITIAFLSKLVPLLNNLKIMELRIS